MSNERLSNLVVLSTENERAKNLNIFSVVDNFATRKSP